MKTGEVSPARNTAARSAFFILPPSSFIPHPFVVERACKPDSVRLSDAMVISLPRRLRAA